MPLFISEKAGIIEVRSEQHSWKGTDRSWSYYDLKNMLRSDSGKQHAPVDKPLDESAYLWAVKHYIPRIAHYVMTHEERVASPEHLRIRAETDSGVAAAHKKVMDAMFAAQAANSRLTFAEKCTLMAEETGISMSNPKPAKVKFLSMYRGEASFEVLDGAMAGQRVRVRTMSEDFYRKDWSFGGPWNMTQEAYIRDVIGSIGLVHGMTKPVSDDVLAAINAEYPDDGSNGANDTGTRFITGEWSPSGWARAESPERQFSKEALPEGSAARADADGGDGEARKPERMRG